MPPSFQDYERGRVLVMYNVSEQVDPDQTPAVLDPFDEVNKGPTFWNMRRLRKPRKCLMHTSKLSKE